MGDEKIKIAAQATLDQYLTQHRMRRTPERFAILDKVFDTTSHFNIDSLHATLDSSGYHVSRATVYNTIELLIKCGLVRRHTFGNQAPQYEKIIGLSKHYHLVCSMCGKIKEIKDSGIDIILSEMSLGRFHPHYVDLNIYGVCNACLRKSRAEARKNKLKGKGPKPSADSNQKK